MSIKKWTLESCHEIAKKYSYRWGFEQANPAACSAARVYQWMDIICSHMESRKKPANYWTFEQCKLEALKYNHRWEFGTASKGAYTQAGKKKWLNLICTHMIDKNVTWTIDTLQKEANRYFQRVAFATKSPNAYRVACRLKILDQICANYPPSTQSRPESELFNIIKSIYPSATKKLFGKRKRKSCGTSFELDIYIPELNKGIEFNGAYWHSIEGLRKGREKWPDKMIQNYHAIKKDFLNKLNISFLEINEQDWNNNKEECIRKSISFLETSL